MTKETMEALISEELSFEHMRLFPSVEKVFEMYAKRHGLDDWRNEISEEWDRVQKVLAAQDVIFDFAEKSIASRDRLTSALASQINSIRGKRKRLPECILLAHIIECEIAGDAEAAIVLTKAKKLATHKALGRVKLRSRAKRGILLWSLWMGEGKPEDISRDKLWNLFCEKYPETLDDVQDERAAKSMAFRDAKLAFLKTNPGGDSRR
jgi:hypothetical protein